MNAEDFKKLKTKSEGFAYTSLKYIEYENVSGFSVISDDNDIVLLYGDNGDFNLKQMHFAFDDLDSFLLKTKEYAGFLMTFVDEVLVERLKDEGYEVFGIWRDYFNSDTSKYEEIYELEFLTEDRYQEASDLTLACKGQSRGFMGQTKEWMEEWIKGKNEEALKINMTDATILTHSEDGELAGIICVGIYGHQSEKGAALWVRELAVHPKYQKRGIAEKLMQQALGYGNARGAKRAFLMADEMNFGALHLYEKMGFERNENECETDMIKLYNKDKFM